MKLIQKQESCPYCGYNAAYYKEIPRCLLPGTKLHDRYILGRVLGEGSFGISYVAWDSLLDTTVAIKEYFPTGLVSRHVGEQKDNTVYVFGEEEQQIYQQNLEKYLYEAKSLSAFSELDGIVSVRDFFYENNTAYIVMGYVDGISLKKYVEQEGALDGREFLEMIRPVIWSLDKVHKTGMLHRDISPDNLLVTKEKRLVLIDFGAARKENALATRTMTIVFKRGYSPEEQYRIKGKQGPYSDVYALCATIYFALTGRIPDEAIDRVLEDEMPSLITMPQLSISMEQKKAVMKGIAVHPKQRYQTMQQLYEDLYAKEEIREETEHRNKYGKLLRIAGIVLLIGLASGVGSVGTIWHKERAIRKQPEQVTETAAVSAGHIEETGEPAASAVPQKVMVRIPSLEYKTAAEVKQLLQKKGLKGVWTHKYSATVAKGRVIGQKPSAGTKVQKGKRIYLTLSKGKKRPDPTKAPVVSRQPKEPAAPAETRKPKVTQPPAATKKPKVTQKKTKEQDDFAGIIP